MLRGLAKKEISIYSLLSNSGAYFLEELTSEGCTEKIFIGAEYLNSTRSVEKALNAKIDYPATQEVARALSLVALERCIGLNDRCDTVYLNPKSVWGIGLTSSLSSMDKPDKRESVCFISMHSLFMQLSFEIKFNSNKNPKILDITRGNEEMEVGSFLYRLVENIPLFQEATPEDIEPIIREYIIEDRVQGKGYNSTFSFAISNPKLQSFYSSYLNCTKNLLYLSLINAPLSPDSFIYSGNFDNLTQDSLKIISKIRDKNKNTPIVLEIPINPFNRLPIDFISLEEKLAKCYDFFKNEINDIIISTAPNFNDKRTIYGKDVRFIMTSNTWNKVMMDEVNKRYTASIYKPSFLNDANRGKRPIVFAKKGVFVKKELDNVEVVDIEHF